MAFKTTRFFLFLVCLGSIASLLNMTMKFAYNETLKEMETLKADLALQYTELRALQDIILVLNASNPTQVLPTSPAVVSRSHQAKSDVVLDLEDFPALVGPRSKSVNTSKSLVVICIGKSDKQGVNRLIQYFPPGPFTYLLFHYDNSTWHEFSWYNSLDVVAIRVLHKMKYWYIKRFLPPNMAQAFSHIIILDADVDFVAPFDPFLYLKVADAFNLAISQPAHALKISFTYHENLYMVPGDHIGRYTDVIECGPAVFLSSKGYQCIYDLMQPDLTSGWGLGLLWVDYVRSVCGFGDNSYAVMDKFLLIHATETGKGTASSLENFNNGAKREMFTLFNRFPNVQQGHQLPDVPFGFSNCINSSNPAQTSSCV